MATARALYVHVPFCHTVCPFCAFAVHGLHTPLRQRYVGLLLVEAEAVAAAEGGGPMDAVYVGGGTPSTLSLDEVAALLDGLRQTFRFTPDVEVAFECNPEDATASYLAGLLERGVNRISLGLQSFDDTTLRRLGRNHDAATSRAALVAARQAGVGNLNVDLMFGAPEIAPAAFRADVAEAIEAAPEHVSLYGLDVEPGTPFGRDARIVEWAEAHREAQAESYLDASHALAAAGYRHYEVSNFCCPGHEGRQNLRVWDGEPYLGLGMGAHSYVGGVRRANHRRLRDYAAAVEAGRSPVAESETPGPVQQANEALMLALRRDSGVDLTAWCERFGVDWDPPRERLLARLVAEGRATLTEAGGRRRLRLTPEGLLLADAITGELMVG